MPWHCPDEAGVPHGCDMMQYRDRRPSITSESDPGLDHIFYINMLDRECPPRWPASNISDVPEGARSLSSIYVQHDQPPCNEAAPSLSLSSIVTLAEVSPVLHIEEDSSPQINFDDNREENHSQTAGTDTSRWWVHATGKKARKHRQKGRRKERKRLAALAPATDVAALSPLGIRGGHFDPVKKPAVDDTSQTEPEAFAADSKRLSSEETLVETMVEGVVEVPVAAMVQALVQSEVDTMVVAVAKTDEGQESTMPPSNFVWRRAVPIMQHLFEPDVEEPRKNYCFRCGSNDHDISLCDNFRGSVLPRITL